MITMLYLFGTLLFLVIAVSANKYYVTPSPTLPCPEQDMHCLTLFQYAKKPRRFFAESNTSVNSLYLLPGNHNLSYNLFLKKLVGNDTTELNIAIAQNASNHDATIVCAESSSIVITNASRLKVKIEGIVVMCTATKIASVGEFVLKDVNFLGQGRNGTGLILKNISFVNIIRSSFQGFTGGMVINEMRNVRGGGALVVQKCQNVLIEDSEFTFNNIGQSLQINDLKVGGGALYSVKSSIYLKNCTFHNNTLSSNSNASYGGAVYTQSSHLEMESCVFKSNSIDGIYDEIMLSEGYGGAVYATRSLNVSIFHCEFIDNSLNNNADGRGGAVYIESSSLEIESCVFKYNSIRGIDNKTVHSEGYGGAIYTTKSTVVRIVDCNFTDNSLTDNTNGFGGAVCLIFGKNKTVMKSIINSTFTGNSIVNQTSGKGGAMYVKNFEVKMKNCIFKNNSATLNDGKGGAIYTLYSKFESTGTLDLMYNSATSGVFYARQSTLKFPGDFNLIHNTGSLFLYASSVNMNGTAVFTNNSVHDLKLLEGGAITGIRQSKIYLNGKINFTHNTARHGGALLAIESEISVGGNVTISGNIASLSGGGLYAYQSVVIFGTFHKVNSPSIIIVISNNTASEIGGGIYCTSSSIKISSSSFNISSNNAAKGGGIGLSQNSKIFILKSINNNIPGSKNGLLNLFDNSAEYGGAIYVTDATNSGICSANRSKSEESTESECFFQVSTFYRSDVDYMSASDSVLTSSLSINFTNNFAQKAGSVLYGGLLDRCTHGYINTEFKGLVNDTNNLASWLITKNSNVEMQDLMNSTEIVTSDPVRVCFCKDNHPDCNYNPSPINEVYKGRPFNVSLVAVDQLNNPISKSTIYAYIPSVEADLSLHQSMQETNSNGTCSNLTYSIFSPNSMEKLSIYAEGPCGKQGISVSNLTMNISHCPIGFSESIDNSHCDCDPILVPEYVSGCSIENASVVRSGDSWFAYNSTNESFTLYGNCPYDYCNSSSEKVFVNLNVENGSDELCSFNRSGKLCGSCKDGLSLVFGGSQCMKCSDNWLAMILVFAIAGFLLVAIILVCNLTVAVGTINGLIFYANVIAANRFLFLPFNTPNILTVFIAWINLDFGFSTCFYDGMDEYVKTWLQFVFPMYILLLVAMVFILPDYWHRFDRLLRNYCHNPVAALSTLILLSYAKFVRIIIAVFSKATLIKIYPDTNITETEISWLNDANIKYSTPERIYLFLASVTVLLIGVAYTLLLFFWHWLDSEKFKKNCLCFKWISKSSKLRDFVKTYQDPYQHDHHYWTGLLLLVRVFLYCIILACDYYPKASVAILVIICCLIFFKDLTGKVYKKRMLNFLDSSYIFNLLLFTGLTIPLRRFSKQGQLALACISVGICFLTFLTTICYHVYKYVLDQEKLLLMIQKLKTPFSPRSRHQKLLFELPSDSTDDQSALITSNQSLTSSFSSQADSISIVRKPEFEDTLKGPVPKPQKTLKTIVLKMECSADDEDETEDLIANLKQLDVKSNIRSVHVRDEDCSTNDNTRRRKSKQSYGSL